MWFKAITLIIFGAQFLFGAQSKHDEEKVGSSAIAKLRAVAAKAQLEHEIALHKLRAHLPHNFLLASNPMESLNSTESILAEPTSSGLEVLETPITELSQWETENSESSSLEETFSERQSNSTVNSFSEETTMNYPQYGESTIMDLHESTSRNPNDLVMEFKNHALMDIFDNTPTILSVSQANSRIEVSTMKDSFNWNIHATGESQHDNHASFRSSTSNSHYGSNFFGLQNANSAISTHDSHSTTHPTIEDNDPKHDFLNSLDLRKLPSYLTTIVPNYDRNMQVISESKVDTSALINAKEKLLTKTESYEGTVHHPQEMPFVENKFSNINPFGNGTPKGNQNAFDFSKPNEGVSIVQNVHGIQFFPEIINPTHHLQEMPLPGDEFHQRIGSLTRNNLKSEVPMEKQSWKNQVHSFNPLDDDLVQRTRNKQDEELFLQHLYMIQGQDNQNILRTAEDDVDQVIQNSQQITFYPINWKGKEVCESLVQQYELSPIKYPISSESSEEDVDKPLPEKFHNLNEKMRSFQSGDYDDENYARTADPADPRHFHSHSFEIHHTKHVRPSNHHSSFNKRKEFSFQSTGHSSHFSLNKDRWKEPPTIFDHIDYGFIDKHDHKDLPHFGHTEKSPTYQLPSKSLHKHLSPFAHSENVHSPTNFYSSSKPLDKQHQDHSIFGPSENLPFPANVHSSSKALDKEHSGQVTHSSAIVQPASHITVNNQNNFISTEAVNGNQNIQIAQGNGAPISQAQALRGDQPFDRSNLGSPYLFQIPRNADNRRFKRSLPLLQLFTDPNVQLDVPKTLENVGTVARNSLEDRQAPMYHVRNMMGSAKNTVLSGLKIPPQDAIVPSRYKIVDKQSELDNNLLGNGDGILKQTKDNFLGNEIVKTFHQVGNIVRESVRSGQETLEHMGDVFHNAKKAVSSTKYVTPRIVLPYARAPTLKRNKPEKIMLITPRFADITQDDRLVGAIQNDDFVKLGDIMDAVGVSNPERKDVGISKLVFQRKKPTISSRTPILDRKLMLANTPTLRSRLGTNDFDKNAKKTEGKSCFIIGEDVGNNEISEIRETLMNMKKLVGTKTLKGFLNYIKQKFLLEHLKDKLRRVEQDTNSNENVGNGLTLSNDLMKPFMGRPSKTELTNYFRKNGDIVEEVEEGFGADGASLSAINPQVYANYYNETLKVNKNVKELTESALPEIATLSNDKIGDFDASSEETTVNMKVPKKLKKPFMGKKIPNISTKMFNNY